LSAIDVFREAYRELEKGYRIALITIIGKEGSGPRDLGATVLFSSSGLKIGSIGGGSFEKLVLEEALKALKDGKPRRVKYALRPEAVPEDAVKTDHLCGGVVEVFINVIDPTPRIIIFGAGNVGKPLADLANLLGYKVVVLDTNPDLANRDRYPYVEEVYAGDLLEYIGKISFRNNDIAIIAYGEVETDYQILKNLLVKQFPGHIWALCSKRRCYWMVERLIKEGVDVDKYVDKLHLPAGLNINSDTPEEIAVSIFSEVICVLKGCKIPVDSLNMVREWVKTLKRVG